MLYYINVFAIGFAASFTVVASLRYRSHMRKVAALKAQIAELKDYGDRIRGEVRVTNAMLIASGDPESVELGQRIKAMLDRGEYTEVNGIFIDSN